MRGIRNEFHGSDFKSGFPLRSCKTETKVKIHLVIVEALKSQSINRTIKFEAGRCYRRQARELGTRDNWFWFAWPLV